MTSVEAADSATGNTVKLAAISLPSGSIRFPAFPIVGLGVYAPDGSLVGSFELNPMTANILGEELRKAAEVAVKSKEDN